MVDVNFVGQLVGAMAEAVEKLEGALVQDNKEYTNRLRIFIIDVHNKIGEALSQVG